MDHCPFCEQLINNDNDVHTLTRKGLESIKRASEQRGVYIEAEEGQKIHGKCRSEFVNSHAIRRDLRLNRKREHDDNTNARRLRSTGQQFDFTTACLYCSNPVNLDTGDIRYKSFCVRTIDFQHSISNACEVRQDEWSQTVKSRLEYAISDLHAADAVYHKVCDSNFRRGGNIPRRYQTPTTGVSETSKKACAGRPADKTKADAFEKVVDFVSENDIDQLTVSHLRDKMTQFSGGVTYTVQYMKQKLIDHFKDSIIITEINGRPNVVTFRKTARSILMDFYKKPEKEDENAEKLRLVKAAAALIKADIKSSTSSKAFYPSPQELSSKQNNTDVVPESLRVLLREIFSEKKAELKIASIGQAIVQAARPRLLILPLQIGLGVQMHHNFSSRFLVDTLNKLGFCSSYVEVKKFEASAAATQSTDIPGLTSESFLQYVADNVDHNTGTLDGFNAFHGMGMIAAVTPASTKKGPIPRVSVTSQDIVARAKVDILYYRSGSGLLSIKYQSMQKLFVQDPTWEVDLLWKVVWPLKSPRPSWSGMMQGVHSGEHQGVSTVQFLPMIDMNPCDMSCVFSTLTFITKEARRHGVTPVLTFDQPLWWKSMIITTSEPKDSDLHAVILRLGAFHTEMSFLGCIGHLMSGSGLQDVLEVTYAPKAVLRMLQGKAVARAVRGHFLVDAALNAMLAAKSFGIQLPELEDSGDQSYTAYASNETQSEADMEHEDDIASTTLHLEPADLQELRNEVQKPVQCAEEKTAEIHTSALSGETSCQERTDDKVVQAVRLYDLLVSRVITTQDLKCDETVQAIHNCLDITKASMSGKPTCDLWLQYMEMVDILKRFLKAERTGDWMLHLKTAQEMLPFMAAAGHNLYTKSLYIYVQQMLLLERDHPDVHRSFLDGHHVIRRSDRFWAGLSTDLAIEQLLMRSVKTAGGLTRGRGISELQRATWLLSMPACAEYNSAMQDFTDTAYTTSEQHKDMTSARLERDERDLVKMLSFLHDRDPFTDEHCLKNIASGSLAHESVNAHKAKQVGEQVLTAMEGQDVSNFTFRRKDQAVTLNAQTLNSSLQGHDKVDPQLLFQRLVTVAGNMFEDKREVFEYELAAYPSALFDSPSLLRLANKATLADEIWKLVKDDKSELPHDRFQVVVDGGALLQRIPWVRGSTYGAIIETYIRYLAKFSNPIVVFDGYESGPSTKDTVHMRRSAGKMCTDIRFSLDMPLLVRKDLFLVNSNNKQRFIHFLSDALEASSIRTLHAKDDADVLIATTAVKCAKDAATVVVGDDTDLLVLLIHHADTSAFDIFFQPEQRMTSKKVRRWDILQAKHALGNVCERLLFAHAVTGCDTTSRAFGIGKSAAMKKVLNDAKFREQADVFHQLSSKTAVSKAGEDVMVNLYNGKEGEQLNDLRYRLFCSKVATGTSFVQVHTLPPTAASTKYHSLRVYLQVQQWIGREDMDPQEWGWKLEKDQYVPHTADLPPAPLSLLHVIKCNCKTDCDSKRCSCRKHGLDCTSSCGQCHGLSCSNSTTPIDPLGDEEEHEEDNEEDRQ